MKLIEDGRIDMFNNVYSLEPDYWEQLYAKPKTPGGKFQRIPDQNLADKIYGKDGDAKVLTDEKAKEGKKRRERKKRSKRQCKNTLLNLFEKV